MSNNDRRAVAYMLFGGAIVGAMVPSFLATVAFFRPTIGVWAYLAAVVYDAAWLAGSWAKITTTSKARIFGVLLVGGVIGAIGINLWQGWSEVGQLGMDIITASAGNRVILAVTVLRHAALPVISLASVHGLATYLRAVPPDVDADIPVIVGAPGVPAITRDEARAWVEAGQLPPNFATSAELARALDLHPSRISEWRRGAATARRNGAGGGE